MGPEQRFSFYNLDCHPCVIVLSTKKQEPGDRGAIPHIGTIVTTPPPHIPNVWGDLKHISKQPYYPAS